MRLENQYLNILKNVRDSGIPKADRTGTGTFSLFGLQIAGAVATNDFPLLTTKTVHMKSVIHELLWFLSGDTNIGYLKENGITIWDEWADSKGNLGPVYGSRWRNWDGVDQIKRLINDLRHHPDSRRMIVNAWDVARLPEMALPPCHMMFQCYSQPTPDGTRLLHLKLYQRSADIFLGVPFNIASYALLLLILAQTTGHRPGRLIHTFGDVHLYANHLEQADLQLSREPSAKKPHVYIAPFNTIDNLTYDHFEVHDYEPQGKIPAPVAV